MDHSFKVGKEYRNRNGRYEVLDIQEPKMRIRYENGREQDVTISTQIRIQQALRDESSQAITSPGQDRRSRTKVQKPIETMSQPSQVDEQEKLIAEILENDKTIFEILTRLTIPPGQIDLYRLFLKNPDDYFSRQQIADEVRESNLGGQQGVFMAFGRRISATPDERVRSLKPYNSLFFDRKRVGGKILLRIRPRVVAIFASYLTFYDFLINDNRSWLPETFGSAYWQNSHTTHKLQMQFFGFWERYQQVREKQHSQHQAAG